MTNWPRSVLRAPLLRGLDARGQDELMACGDLRPLAAGDTLYERGGKGDSLYIVAEGRLSLTGKRRHEGGELALREAGPGDSLGEEASIGATWRAHARAEEASLVAEIPVAMLRRALTRAGAGEIAERIERRMRRRATAELLATTAFTAELGDDERERWLDACRHHELLRGDVIYRQGERATHMWIVADGMVQLQTSDDDKLRVKAYLVRGDFFGDQEVLDRLPYATTAVASGASLLIAVPADVVRAADDGARMQPLRRLAIVDRHAAIAEAGTHTTQHAFKDLYRLSVARSLLVIDLDTCVRCGHCAWSCESLHGVARIVRRGDKIVTRTSGQETAPLLLPNSCQHCDNPACMPDCPTGAIGRDPGGEVVIRDALCTGCGACARGCPWDNIQIVPRPADSPRPVGGVFDELAVKCDLCRDYQQGPACVAACPTESIFRINPTEALTDVAAALGEDAPVQPLPVRRRAWPLLLVLASLALALALHGYGAHAAGRWTVFRGEGYAAGIAAAVALVALFAYVLPKRLVRVWARFARDRKRSRLRPQLWLHSAIGMFALAAVVCHAGGFGELRSAGSAAAWAYFAASAFGALAALAYAALPRRLARLERRSVLPEDYADVRRELSDRLFNQVTGKSELVKKLFESVLSPYAKRPFGWLWLLLSGRSVSRERELLRARIDGMLQGRGSERLAGLDQLIGTVVELRALPAQRLLTLTMRCWLPLHIVAATGALVLVAIHVWQVIGG